ncbi:MAG TPA: hypothetical protein ENI85_14890 [Deltaproteobacteria bacterium]|nr:hypothetical protein [Deltaproteobacteria bacterium]
MDGLDGIGIESALAAGAERQAEEDKVGQADFLKLLVAQLENQDPLNPQDSAAFATQLAQFSSVEQLVAMRAGIDALVAKASEDGVQGSRTTGLDPTQLIGREVVVFGSQIEVDDARTPIRLPFRTIDDAVTASVRIYDDEGNLRHEQSILPSDAAGRPVALRPGDHEFVFDPAAQNLPPGVYAIEFSATGAADQEVTILPMVEGLVSGAVLTGERGVRIGSRIFPLQDILEVRLPSDPAGTTS